MRIAENFVAATPKDFNVFGNFFRLESAAAAVDVDFYRAGSRIAENLRAATSGYWCAPEGGFDRVVITSSANQAIAADVYQGRVGADRVAGSVIVSSVDGMPTVAIASSGAAAVSNVSVQVAAALAGRKYLIIQNQDATGNLYLNIAGAAAAVGAGCLRLPPGAVYEPAAVPSNAIMGIMDYAAAGANVLIAQG